MEGKIFSFYNKLRNIGTPHGVFLIPLESVRLDGSLCPDEYKGCSISDDRYLAMGATLYEKLSDVECIPEKFTRTRHLVDRYVDINDGYQVLYELLEESHPALDKDPDHRPPLSDNCDGDIQEYTAQYQIYLKAEKLNGRTYKEYEQVRNYLQGLGEDFAPAVQYVKTLMKSWGNPASMNPLTTLRLLPKTIEDYMSENNISTALHHQGPGQIRALTDPNIPTIEPFQPFEQLTHNTAIDQLAKIVQQHVEHSDAIIKAAFKPGFHAAKQKPAGKSVSSIPNTNNRKFADVFCESCTNYGHEWSRCDFTARIIHSLEFVANLDPVKKQTILQSFATEQAHRREQKQTNLAGKARILRDSGDAEALYQLLLTESTEDDTDSVE